MLFKRLRDLYNENEVLAKEYPLDEYFPLLQNFIAKEVSLGAEYLSPYRFALSYSKSPKEAIRFFLGLTDSEHIIKQQFKYECDRCGKINIIKDEESLFNFKCRECGFEDNLTSSPDYLSEVKLLFRINEELLEEVKKNLKDNPLSNVLQSSSAVLERGIDEEVSLESAEELIYKDGKPIGKRSMELQRKIRRYRDIMYRG
ncbi:hypothetical protein GS3922_07995 [Geobacillus subterraneus]|jgi:hypothetical protein|uniref:Uncharacterized protein n=2 Tax=Geobacillus TaxID=129337 RepID=A0ABM6ABF1_9BACL|nr:MULTISPECIES: hypothetical protein [Geobacillus]AMX83612.1 hypothetical protein GS3922_07995 [Geobacillus subterraneus]KZS26559.1 hypothetical protein A5418_01900 [Geobacillus subterraneus]OXB90281.1 hypothetical protein B9L21_05810 [Geobacillus uzenensis]